ncbi:hypothetical protein S2091_3985 [Solimicrobium silvestre]|uniref:Uncharacterized protein n=1 Tax=Solimicrobium silvestre TaxID=2099400 RepID=A0A2S9GUD0_9BURK|nr:hypothetical protein S2091_3985 [Solimicrobium silvestre]
MKIIRFQRSFQSCSRSSPLLIEALSSLPIRYNARYPVRQHHAALLITTFLSPFGLKIAAIQASRHNFIEKDSYVKLPPRISRRQPC